MRKYGYPSPTVNDRLDFTGRHFCSVQCAKSGLTLVTKGYDSETDTITDAEGCVALIDSSGNVASSWTIAKLMGHWKRKHARAAYIPSLSQNNADKTRSYSYCNNVRLFEGTSIRQLLSAITEQDIYYDPGIKLVDATGKASIKRRSQFRIKSSQLHTLYKNQEDIDLLTV